MKKLLGIVLFSAVLTVSTFAFDLSSFPSPIQKNSVLLNGGLGIGSLYGGWTSSGFLGGYVAVDYALPINFGLTVGAEVGFAGGAVKNIFGEKVGYSIAVIPILARIAWHPNFEIRNLDTYLLAKFGYGIGFWGGKDAKLQKALLTNPGGLVYGFNVGARYFFTDSLGAFVEGGYEYYILTSEGKVTGYSWGDLNFANRFVTLGITFKL
jgi:hypothetical protein